LRKRGRRRRRLAILLLAHNDSLYSLLKKLLIQAHAFRRAASSSNEFDDADFVSISHLRKRGRRRRRLAILLLAFVPDFFSRDEAFKGKEERVWTDREYIKACEELAYGAVEIDSTKQCGGRMTRADASTRHSA
jgi:hypothetical protein